MSALEFQLVYLLRSLYPPSRVVSRSNDFIRRIIVCSRCGSGSPGSQEADYVVDDLSFRLDRDDDRNTKQFADVPSCCGF